MTTKPTRRNNLQEITKEDTTNAGLWLDKFIKDQDKPLLVKEVAAIPVSEAYRKFFERWENALTQLTKEAQVPMYRAKVLGRMAVGLGSASVLETSIKLHHTYGVPYIPGSALKGLTASYAHQCLGAEWKKDSKDHDNYYKILFGTSDENGNEQAAGYVTFFDALYVPEKGNNRSPLCPDVMTVHHEDYYQNKENSAPADWDQTNPISFLSAKGEYLLALTGPKEWVNVAFDILKLALEEMGIGAKTSSGYGQMERLPLKASEQNQN